MRQLIVRLLAFLVVILVIFGLYRLITVQPLKPSDFFVEAKKAPLVIADTGHFTRRPPHPGRSRRCTAGRRRWLLSARPAYSRRPALS